MLIIDRQKKLLEILRQRQSAPLEQLAEELAVSSSTVRRDIDALAGQGLVESTRGGVIFRDRGSSSLDLDQRMQEQVHAKRALGKAAAALIEPGMTVFFDGGSTMRYTAEQVEARPLQVVTNSLTIANLFVNDDRVEMLLLGGALYPRSGVLVGPITTQALSEIHADLMLFSVAGVYERDTFNSNLAMVQIEKLAIRQAARRILVADSTKFGRKGLARVCSISDLDQIITDSAISPSWRSALADRLQVVET
ncbi:MAG TPA: DeoR/GlpR family DNA-binding transcription regulator [Phycisphaerae bacterium]|nr:DeoR/GlpR family DNA-binding transcription regulator [Phycisphaerae bacterium]